MRQEEKQVIMQRFSQMHTHFLRLISSDPDNARYYKIMVDHYRKQYCALGKNKKDKETTSDDVFLSAA